MNIYLTKQELEALYKYLGATSTQMVLDSGLTVSDDDVLGGIYRVLLSLSSEFTE